MDVQFQEERRNATPAAPQTNGILTAVVNSGFAEDERQASFILLGGVTTVVIVSLGILLFSGGTTSTITPEEYERNAASQPIPNTR